MRKKTRHKFKRLKKKIVHRLSNANNRVIMLFYTVSIFESIPNPCIQIQITKCHSIKVRCHQLASIM